MKVLFGAILALGGLIGETAVAQSGSCPVDCAVIDIPGTTDKATQAAQRQLIKDCLASPNKTIRLGPDVDLDFTDFPQESLPITFGSHSSLISVAALEPVVVGTPSATASAATSVARTASVVSCPTLDNSPGSARTPHSRGPVIRYGDIDPTRYSDLPGTHSLLNISCIPGSDSEGSRISGFQLIGPSPDAQQRSNTGITIDGCLDVEVSNLEIWGWGAAAITVTNSNLRNVNDHRGEPNPIRVLIHDNFIHNNQYPEHDGHALGYGVNTGLKAWSRIYQNVFDNNKHAITAGFDAGGYDAEHNLVLKGGGHEDLFDEKYIHIFDVHGSEDCFPAHSNCGYAGDHFLFFENAFQYKKEIDIKIRGKPRIADPPTLIAGNVFARSDEKRAIDLNVPGNVKVTNNVYNVDTYGDYGVCDFDGDGKDDLFLATGVSWWFSSAGQFQWTHLNNQKFRRSDVRLGYFDADQRCDVLVETTPGHWFISSGGTSNWKEFGNFLVHLNEVQFGRFDARVRDHRPNVTRQTTHAFWRRLYDGQWLVTPLSHRDWQPVASSKFPLDQLRFGDFTGDGVTDVLAVVDGHWAISESATGSWRQLNSSLGDPVANLFIANMDADDNIDDVLRVSSTATLDDFGATVKNTLTWWRSKNGTEPWKIWGKPYEFSYPKDDADFVSPGYVVVGRFGAAHEGATMVTDPTRVGRFHSEVEKPVKASRDWLGMFPY